VVKKTSGNWFKVRIFWAQISILALRDADNILRIQVLEAANASLRLEVSRIALVESENVSLKRRVSELEQLVLDLVKKAEQKGVVKDSQNSSKPPSSDFGR